MYLSIGLLTESVGVEEISFTKPSSQISPALENGLILRLVTSTYRRRKEWDKLYIYIYNTKKLEMKYTAVHFIEQQRTKNDSPDLPFKVPESLLFHWTTACGACCLIKPTHAISECLYVWPTKFRTGDTLLQLFSKADEPSPEYSCSNTCKQLFLLRVLILGIVFEELLHAAL